MRLTLLLSIALGLAMPGSLLARTVVDASEPSNLAVSVYRDPYRASDEEMDPNWPRGFAMISETRTVTLPRGESTIRFDGVAEGMVAVSAIVSGLPGGTIEKNRNAELLSPAALVNGALGNRVRITRANPATGEEQSQDAIVRTRADGGLVLQTDAGYEAVRCAGVPERLSFNTIPDGLSAKPVFSIDTYDQSGGTYDITLTYLSWGFDWQANYVATLTDKPAGNGFGLSLLSWLTVLNDNAQSFDNAELLVIAGTLNIESDFEELADPPVANPLRLTCYPIGSTATGSMLPPPPPPPPPPPAAPVAMMQSITVTGSRLKRESAADVMEATEENLGDLKLYRVPERVTVSAKGLKQVAFVNRTAVEAQFLYVTRCEPWTWLEQRDVFRASEIYLVTKNEEERGLGVALPQGAMAVFEPSSFGPQLVAETDLRDYASGQDIELTIAESAQVQAQCGRTIERDPQVAGKKWTRMQLTVTNANTHPINSRVLLGESGEWDIRFPRQRTQIKNGYEVVEISVPANETRTINWRIRLPKERWKTDS